MLAKQLMGAAATAFLVGKSAALADPADAMAIAKAIPSFFITTPLRGTQNTVGPRVTLPNVSHRFAPAREQRPPHVTRLIRGTSLS